jgi:NTE family protein
VGISRKKLGLALGGGGARGMAHVGVIRVLEREGIPIDCIAGTSVGSLVGAAYAAGLRGQPLLDMALNFRWRAIVRLVWPGRGFVSFDKLESFLVRTIGDLTFAGLGMPYAAVTADLATGEQVVLQEGRVAPVVRASCSVPGIVTPVEVGGRLLIDGGVVNNLPISVVRGLGAEVVVAVGLGSPPGTYPRGPLQMGIAALDFLLRRAGDDPSTADVHLPIPIWGLGSFLSTARRRQFVALGEQTTEEALPAIRAALD